jgi:hypothetical protein
MADHQSVREPSCILCAKPIDLEAANTDEQGRAVHENCYAALITSDGRTIPVVRPRDLGDQH